jgi:hypothetical protein
MNKMSGSFAYPVMTERQKLERRYESSLSSLLLITVFSAVNLVLLLTNSDSYFLFSAYIPYLLGDYAMFFCGRYPEEYYADIPDMEFFGTPVFAVIVAVAVLFVLFYLLCWLFAKKKKAVWLIFALSLFIIDTIIMFIVVGFSPEMIMDVIFHAWAIVSLALGISAYTKLKKLPEEEEIPFVPENVPVTDVMYPEDSPVLRMADPDGKAKTFVEADFGAFHISFQRAKRVNELIVNGRVYAEFEVLFESAHTLEAVVGGHKIEAGYDGKIMTFIKVDGKELAKKARLI